MTQKSNHRKTPNQQPYQLPTKDFQTLKKSNLKTATNNARN